MSTNALVSTALVLLLSSVPQMTNADSYTAKDVRMVIPVTAEERNQVLFEMRELLHVLFSINASLSSQNFEAMAVVAKPMGPLLNKFPASLKGRLPEQFLLIGNGFQQSLDALVNNARDHKDLSLTLRDESELLTYCSGCHDQFRFELSTSNSNK